MKKLSAILLVTAVIIGCSKEFELNSITEDLSKEIIEGESLSGVYKGVFTTLNSEYRATVRIDFPNKNLLNDSKLTSEYPVAIFKLHSGEIFTVTASEKMYKNEAVSNLEFNSQNLSFRFSVEENGQNPIVSEVFFKELEASILIAKHTNRAPVTPITGTYNCTDCGNHPNLDNGMTQTFNMIFTVAEGEGSMTTQSMLGTKMFSGIGYQDACTANGTITNCVISSGDGSTTTTGYTANGNPVTWIGKHVFNNELSGPNDCSGVSGAWEWMSNGYGLMTGKFESDVNCYQTLYYEDFEIFLGTGFSPTPVAGQLDSDVIIATGFSDGDLDYGDVGITGDFARGADGFPSEGGIYAADIDGFDEDFTDLGVSFLVKPNDTDFTPGTVQIRVQNNTGNTLSSFRINYEVHGTNGNSDWSNSMNFSYSTNGNTFFLLTELEYISTEVSVATGGFPPELPQFLRMSSTFLSDIVNGAYIYLKFEGDDVSGTGTRDGLLIDNIRLEGI